MNRMLLVLVPLFAVVSSPLYAQTTTYHLHQESSQTSGLRALKTAGPDTAPFIKTNTIYNTLGPSNIGIWDTQPGVPNQNGVILQGSTVTFTVWFRKTSKWATVYPQAALAINYWDYGTSMPICEATGSTPVTQSWAAYTFSCTSPVTIWMKSSDRLTVWLSMNVTVGPGNHNANLESGFEGTLNGNYDTRVVVTNAVPFSGVPQNCPAADPNDTLPDDAALQACLNLGGVVKLAPINTGSGYILQNGLVITQSNTTLMGSLAITIIKADPLLAAPMLTVAPGVANYTISLIEFDGNRTARLAISDCASDLYEVRAHGYNLQLRGSTFLVEGVNSSNAMCGSAMEVFGEYYWIRGNWIANNGFEENESVFGSWSDGITILQCKKAWIYENTLSNNTDVDLIIGPSGGTSHADTYCYVQNNTISHTSRYAFAGLMIGFGGDHVASHVNSNAVSSSLNKLAFGIMVGHHPWDPTLDHSNGDVSYNTTAGSVTPLAIDGIDGGAVTNNQPTNPQGTNGFGECALSAAYTAAHFGSATIQPNSYPRDYHNGGCTP